MLSEPLLVVGGGNMGTALVEGLLATGVDRASLAVVERSAQRRRMLADLGVAVAESPPEASSVLLAVKPGDAEEACRALRWASAGRPRLLSIVAGVRCSSLERWNPQATVLRAMPNLAATVGRSATALCPGAGATDEDLAWAEQILASVGTVLRVPESLMDAATAVCGSGPAFVALFAEAMIEAGVALGLARDGASRLVAETVAGAGELLSRAGGDPVALRHAVTSPGGTTAAGLQALEARALRAAVAEAVRGAAARAEDLAGG